MAGEVEDVHDADAEAIRLTVEALKSGLAGRKTTIPSESIIGAEVVSKNFRSPRPMHGLEVMLTEPTNMLRPRGDHPSCRGLIFTIDVLWNNSRGALCYPRVTPRLKSVMLLARFRS